MSNHATFIAAKRVEMASLTAQLETKLTRQGEPRCSGGEHEERSQRRRTVVCRSEGGPGQREGSGSRGTPSYSRNNVPQWRVSPHRRWKSSASSVCGGQHSNSYIQIGDEMVCLLIAELDGDDSKKLCCIKSFDGISAEKMIRSH